MAYVPVSITEEQLAALDDQHDGVLMMRGKPMAPWLVVIRRPNEDEAIAYKAMANDTAKKTFANVKLLKACAVYPDPKGEDWKKQFARWPLALDGIAASDAFTAYTGVSCDQAEK